MDLFESFLYGIKATTWPEWLAVVCSVCYVLLAAIRSIWCWVFALAASLIYVYLCINYQLYIESGLQAFYVLMAIYGWVVWSRKKIISLPVEHIDQVSDKKDDEIKRWPFKLHVINIGASGIAASGLGFVFDTYTDQAYPYIDAFTTCYSLAATFMVTRKVLENWIYWIVIDAVSIWLYAQRSLILTAVLSFLFTILAVIGFVKWRKKYKMQRI